MNVDVSALSFGDQRLAVDHARRRCWRSADRRASSGAPSTSTELAELAVVADGDDDVAVARPGTPGRARCWDARCPCRRRRLAADQVVQRLVGEHGDRAVEQRHVDMRALARLVAPAQRRQDADGRVHAGEDVDDRDADLLGSPSGCAGDVHDAAHALDHEVVAGARRHRGRSGRSR